MAETNFLKYKEKPLVRSGNEIYYGDMSEPYVVRFEILSTRELDGKESADKVSVQLLKSDIQLPMDKRIVKETVRESMYDALDFGFVWLERALKE